MHLPNDLSISSIETTPFRLPMRGSLRWGAHSSMDEARHVLVRVRLGNGSEGIAEAPPRPTIYGETVDSIVSIIRNELAPRVVGVPLAQVQTRLQQVRNNHTAKGAVDIALHDAVAKSRGVSLANHLGSTQERVRVSFILGMGSQDESLAEAEEVVAQGVRVLKVKVGRDWAGDLAQIDALRAALLTEVDLYADANECMDAADAANRLAALRERGLLYCEEPLPVEQVMQRARLRAAQVLPIIGDDSCFTLRDLQRELALDTFDILNIKTPRTGYTESLAMRSAAQAAGKGIMLGSQASAGLGTARAAIFAALPGIEHPAELSFPLKLKEDIIQSPIPIRDGWMWLADVTDMQLDLARLREMSL